MPAFFLACCIQTSAVNKLSNICSQSDSVTESANLHRRHTVQSTGCSANTAKTTLD